MKVYAVLLCGGSGSRMGAKENKTLLSVGGVPAIVRCARAFQGIADGAVLVARAGDEEIFRQTLAAYGLTPLAIVSGGDDRQESALRGLQAIPEKDGIALIHDGARPFVTKDIIRRVIDSVKTHDSGVAAVPARDTIKRADGDGLVLQTLNRAELWHTQTPQGFWIKDLLAAHASVSSRYTDDAALMEAAGHSVHLVMGGYDNIKLTSQEDLKMVSGMQTPRIGTGYDAHRLVEGRELWLGGVKIPYEKGLLGHSDADVALHALTDALLGAAALGDIGQLFPDSDMKYKDISSLILLREARRVMVEKGFSIGSVDVTIVAQAPKLAPYIPHMRHQIAVALQIPENRASVKATTTERMGFEGRGEGISAQAAAVVFENAGGAEQRSHGPMGETLRSERLTYRPVEEKDAPAYRSMLTDPAVTEPAGFQAITDDQTFDHFFAGLRQGGLGIAILRGEDVIGYLRPYPENTGDDPKFQGKSCVGLGFLIGGQYQRRGYGTEMLNFLTAYFKRRFDYVFADAFIDNLPSNRLIQKCGYRYLEDYTMRFDELGKDMTCHSYVF